MRALYAALLVTLVGLPVSAQKPVQKAAPFKGDIKTLLVFEERAQQYADRLVVAADKGENMNTVNYLVTTTSRILHDGQKYLDGLKTTPLSPADAKRLGTIQQHHTLAQKAFDNLRAELNVKDRNPKRGTVMKLSYQLSDEAMLAQGKTPPKHPIIKEEEVGPKPPKK
ncbi:MAG TPA: hypothetical protein VF832_12620 [Longimicrobiales bacterium]